MGAGLPIIDTYRKLAESGDRVLRIHGCVSGTLTFVLSEVSAGRPFSAAVKEAMTRGYAEPDPRDDLSGRDAARKGLILARMMGYRGPAPAADDLVPPAYRHLPLDEFLERLPELDAMWRDRVARAAAQQRQLRYVVSATNRKVSVGLRPVPGVEPDRRGSRHPEHRHVPDAAVSHRAAGDQRAWRGRAGDRRRHHERHLFPGPRRMTPDAMLRSILNSRVYDVVTATPLDAARRLSRRTGHQVFLKREDLQPIFTYKLRGAYNRMAHLSAEERERGVITASAGNHAQGVAYSARHLRISALIVMPQTTPEIKVDAVRDLGAEVELAGDTFADAAQRCHERTAASGRILIHPFDDPLVIAGQGTVAVEILSQAPHELSAVFVPVGGGGLIAGIASYIKAIRPHVRIIGVEPFEADAMYQSLAAGRRIALDRVGIFADGVAVREVGALTFAIAQAQRRRSDSRLERRDLRGHQGRVRRHPIADGTGGRAGGRRPAIVGRGRSGDPGQTPGGGVERRQHELRSAAIRGRARRGRRSARSAVRRHHSRTAGRISRILRDDRPPCRHGIQLSPERPASRRTSLSGSRRHRARKRRICLRPLQTAGYPAIDLTDDEVAKLHIRHMVGGRAPALANERLYRFEFPERPGALLEFLDRLGGRWNISLFHYRNHGSDFGRVLAGFEVPEVRCGPVRRIPADARLRLRV